MNIEKNQSTKSRSVFLSIKNILNKFKNINYAFLFGSFLKGDRENGDIDILISGNMDFSTKIKISSELEILLKKSVDIVMVNNAPVSLVLKAMSIGKLIIINKINILKKEYFKSFYAYDNNSSLRRIKREKLIRNYLHG